MRILFLESPAPYLVRQHVQIPVGLLMVATIAQNAGHEVKFIRPMLKKELLNYPDYDIICLGGTTLEYPMNEDCAKLIRKHFPKTKIFIGGVHVSSMFKEVNETKLFDAICVGEGENLILEMINDVEKNQLKPVYFMKEYVKDLDSLPFINYDLVETKLGKGIFFDKKEGDSINFLTSRGCPFNCSFCASQAMWTRKVRYRSIDSIIEEMELLKKKYNINQFRLADDNLTSNSKRCLEFCKKVKPLKILWRCSIRAESVTEEIANAMYDSGAREMSPGIENLDQRVLDFLHKNTTVEKMFKGCINAQRAGLKVRGLFMAGVPGERLDSPLINETLLKVFPIDYATLSTFIPLPGTPIFNDPDSFNCEILSKNFRQYNKDFYQKIGEEAKKREYTPLIHNKFLTMEEQKWVVGEMERVIKQTNYNKG